MRKLAALLLVLSISPSQPWPVSPVTGANTPPEALVEETLAFPVPYPGEARDKITVPPWLRVYWRAGVAAAPGKPAEIRINFFNPNQKAFPGGD
jgi:hypothetical protein